jgi:hypothetical protein
MEAFLRRTLVNLEVANDVGAALDYKSFFPHPKSGNTFNFHATNPDYL